MIMTEAEQTLFDNYRMFTGLDLSMDTILNNPTMYADDDGFVGLYARAALTGDQPFKYGHFTDDRDGKTYNTVTFDGRTWMSENFAYVPKDATDYVTTSRNKVLMSNHMRKVCFYELRDNTDWYESLVPEGWHIATCDDYLHLIDRFGVSLSKREAVPFGNALLCKPIILNDILNLRMHGFFELTNNDAHRAKLMSCTLAGVYLCLSDDKTNSLLFKLEHASVPSNVSKETAKACLGRLVSYSLMGYRHQYDYMLSSASRRYPIRLVKDY